MHECVQKSMNDSNSVMERIKPIVCKLLKSDKIFTVENVDNEVCKLLDVTCGIDYLEAAKDRVRGIANRIQWIKPNRLPYNTFTIRKGRESGADTEFKKRLEQIKSNGLYPYLTMHTYVESGTGLLLSLGIARTIDVIDYILTYNPKTRESEDEHGRAWFYYCPWDDMTDKNYHVLTCNRQVGQSMRMLFTQFAG